LNRARVTPVFHDNVADLTIRAHVLDYLSWDAPDASFQIMTPMTRIRIPLNLLDSIFGGRDAIVSRELEYDEVDLRITIIDQSENERYNMMFETVYPLGHTLSSLIEFRVELVEVSTGEVFFTAVEFDAPIEMRFVVMDNAGHLRPAGVSFQRAWLEFVPYRSPSPNEVVLNSIFPGVQGVIHNRVHFEDIPLIHWSFIQSYTAGFSGLTVPMTELHPLTPLTRGEFAQLLASTLQLPRADAHTSGFVDVLQPNVFFDGVSRLFAAGLLGPHMPGAQFHPNAIITREEIAAIIGMALIIYEPIIEPELRPIWMEFTDFAEFSSFHMITVQETVNYRIMVGYPDRSFRPQMPATRIYALEGVIGLARALGVIDGLEWRD
jgi:hypothetical protein